jgi:hypothetical protein
MFLETPRSIEQFSKELSFCLMGSWKLMGCGYKVSMILLETPGDGG